MNFSFRSSERSNKTLKPRVPQVLKRAKQQRDDKRLDWAVRVDEDHMIRLVPVR
jgi:hypothetical protein